MRTFTRIAFLALLLVWSCERDAARAEDAVRPAALAGAWYPADAKNLGASVDAMLAAAPKSDAKGRVFALIVPHAGYVYSGRVAGAAYRQVAEKKFGRVVVLAPSHHGAFRGFSIMDVDAYETPLGRMPLDRAARDALRKNPLHVPANRLHEPEHAIEIQLPFLQRTIFPAKLVPILVGQLSEGDASAVADALKPWLSQDTLIVVSTDFTHYGPRFRYVPFADDVAENLRKLDMGAANAILKKEPGSFDAYVQETGATICGRAAITVLLRCLPPDAAAELLRYDTSGRMTGDFNNSVSYVSMLFTVPSEEGAALSDDEKRLLLRLARETIAEHLRTGKSPDLKTYPLTERLKKKAGAFVTLKKHGELRGCIGRIGYPEIADELPSLHDVVKDMAVAAALNDQRFDPVAADELKDIEIEISVLTVAREIPGWEDFEVGRHGIIIRKAYRGAVFLPQVAVEQNWDRAKTLSHLCVKAGLPRDAWREKDMHFFVFTAEVFDDALLNEP